MLEKRMLLADVAGASMPDIIKARNALAEAQLDCGPWKCSNDEQALIDHANAVARAVEVDAAQLGPEKALALALHRVRERHLTPPNKPSLSSMLESLKCPRWWGKRLRKLTNQRREQRQRLLGRTQKKAGLYLSDEVYCLCINQANRNARYLEESTAVNQEGDEYTLAELAELGTSNPDHRYSELMVRINDSDRYLTLLGYVCDFVTITAPSCKHPMRHNGSPNPKYDGSNPREANDYLQGQWAKIRAKLKRDGLYLGAFRIVEPHHDGTPHWHIIVWTLPEERARVINIMRRYAIEHFPEEVAHNPSIRFKAVQIDPSKGSVAAYVAKYVCKSINGKQFVRAGVAGDDLDLYGEPLATSAPRVAAWASTWRIRQFSFIGIPSVTVWRELRRLSDESRLADWEAATRPEPEAAAILDDLRKAAIAGDWYQYFHLMGGPNQPRNAAPVRPWRVVHQTTDIANFDRITGEWTSDKLGRYGEPMASTWGLVVNSEVGQAEYLTRYYRWTIERKGEAGAVDFKRVTQTATPLNLVGVGVDFQRAGEAEAPWTCINNCTDVEENTQLDDWAWHEIEAFKRKHPPIPREQVRRIQQQAKTDAHQYRIEAVRRRLEHEDRERLRDSLDEGRQLLIGMLARGELSPADIPPGAIA